LDLKITFKMLSEIIIIFEKYKMAFSFKSIFFIKSVSFH